MEQPPELTVEEAENVLLEIIFPEAFEEMGPEERKEWFAELRKDTEARGSD